jgi:hypothetical protein
MATLAGIMMQATSSLPAWINRGYFSDILFDHLPWTTIASIFLVQCIFVLFYHSIDEGRFKKYIREMVKYISDKLVQFCPPAFSVILGLSLASTIWSIISIDISYLRLSAIFGWFSVFFLVIPFLSDFLKKELLAQRSKNVKNIFKVIGSSLVGAICILPFINNQPIELDVKFSLSEFDTIERAAGKVNVSVETFVRDSTLSRSVELHANQ